MIVLGINAYHGDVAVTIIRDGTLVAAVEEERFTRVKHSAGFPWEAMRSCLEVSGIMAKDVDCFSVSRNPRAHMFRKMIFALRNCSAELIWERLSNSNRVRGMADAIADGLCLERNWVQDRLCLVEHHLAHLASAFFVSPFEESAVCAIDGFGDFVSRSTAVGRGLDLTVLERIYFPHSLGLFYLAMTQYLGFPKYGDEYKVMGLAPYGEPIFADDVRRLIRLRPDGQFRLDLSYFRHWSDGVNMTWHDGEPSIAPVFTPNLEKLLGPARKPDEPIEPRHEAVAASLQVVFEEAAIGVLNSLYQRTRLPRLCLAGGCAMNSVMNGKIRERTPFREVYIQPAAGDDGTALGAALYVSHQMRKQPRRFVMDHAFWGPEFDDEAIAWALKEREGEIARLGCRVGQISDQEVRCQWTAREIADGKIVGWFQGRMEWGARALGNRSILADARRHNMREIINTKIKGREKFRPFAPSILEEALSEYFVGAVPDPFMVQVYSVRTDKRSVIPAVTHVDGTGRVHTVNRLTNRLYWQLLSAFQQLTGVPVLLNTSFNENEPIVHRPAEAIDCFLRTQMDILVLGERILEKGRTTSAESA